MASESAAQLKWVKYVLIGSGLAIGWFLMFVIGGAIWSVIHTNTLGVMDHIINGIIFAKLMNLLSIAGGASVGLHALLGLSKSKNQNFGVLGFILVHFTIVILLWVAAPLESRQDPLPDRMLDRLFDIKEQIESPSLSRAATN